MSTSRWRSSLSNAETRIRRSLGISGPIDLELQHPPQLTPVMIVDDATRPGTSQQIRGRRWRTTANNGVAAGGRASHWLYCAAPYAPSSGPPDMYSGGVIVDRVMFSLTAGVAENCIVMLGIFATNLVLAPGIPVAVTTSDVYFVDPMRTDGEPAPLQTTGTVTTQDPGAARKIWEHTIGVAVGVNPGVQHLTIPCGDIFLNWNSCLVWGISGILAQATTCYVSYEGRIF